MATPDDGDWFAGLDHDLPPPTSTQDMPTVPATAPRRSRKRRPKAQRPAFPVLFTKRRNQIIAEFLIFTAWCDWLIGIAPCPSRWPYSEYRKDMVEKLLERVKFEEPPGMG